MFDNSSGVNPDSQMSFAVSNLEQFRLLIVTLSAIFFIWGFPGMGGTPKWLFFFRENPTKIRMMTGGTPMT